MRLRLGSALASQELHKGSNQMSASELVATGDVNEVRLTKALLRAKIDTLYLLKWFEVLDRCRFWYILHT
jgi:hypothetical protein